MSTATQEICRPIPWDLKVLNLLAFLLTLLGSLVAPFYAELGSKNLQISAQVGFRSGISGLLGSFLLSRCSDLTSRRAVLWVAFGGNALSNVLAFLLGQGLIASYLSTFFILGATSVIRALFGDFCNSMRASSHETTSWLSMSALAVAVPSAIGPALGPQLSTSFETMQLLCVTGTVLVTPIILLLSAPQEMAKQEGGLLDPRKFLNIKVARTTAGIWCLVWCFLMVFVYNVCQTMLMPSLKSRFDVDAQMLGKLASAGGMGAMVGFSLAGSIQRRFCKPHPTYLISSFMCVTFAARVVMFSAGSFNTVVAANFVLSMFGVGVIGPLRQNMLVEFVPQEEFGGFIGMHEAVSSFSGIMGPLFAGILSLDMSLCPKTIGFLMLYAMTPMYAFFGYPLCMQPVIDRRRREKAEKAA